MKKLQNYPRIFSKQQGFNLVEIMVGLVIGLLATLVIVNVFTVFEQQKRATTGNSDAQTNGAIALYNLERDIQLAGYGMPVYDSTFSPYKCGTENDAVVANVLNYDHDEKAATAPIGISPLVVTDGGANGSDRIAIRSGNSARGGIATPIYNQRPTNVANLETNIGCQIGDTALMLLSEKNTICKMGRVTNLVGMDGVEFAPALTLTADIGKGLLACLGAWNEVVYAVNNKNELTRLDMLIVPPPDPAAPPAIVPEIMSMQAQYGVSATPDSNIIVGWVDATGAWANINNAAARNSIKAVRVAIVARSGLIQPQNVTATCSSLTATAPTGLCAWEGSAGSPAPSINLAAADADWRRYRYRVYESIIPMRNVIWSKTKLKVN